MSTPRGVREHYPAPQYATPNGCDAYYDCIDGDARELKAELDQRAVRDLNAGRRPEQTEEIVRQVKAELDGRPAVRDKPSPLGTLATIFLTIAAVGPAIAAGLFFAHSTAEVLTFSAFGLVA